MSAKKRPASAGLLFVTFSVTYGFNALIVCIVITVNAPALNNELRLPKIPVR